MFPPVKAAIRSSLWKHKEELTAVPPGPVTHLRGPPSVSTTPLGVRASRATQSGKVVFANEIDQGLQGLEENSWVGILVSPDEF